ncbi:G-protein coupled receptor [Podospora aff. communis PSN243]|uniref:G-protein coupled receptor n=1 Tax=Podospora aff. communis PSN243 TaxID=3040156 RepID=A0AAV9H0I6_9PEZI|nr:G-protein coupled receptor [Podospora aff. communis PSN243]
MDRSQPTPSGQLDLFSIIERACSVFSLLGCFFIIITFCSSKAFHKPINRLVFYASFGNAITNVATLMARSYIGDTNSAGCQFQAFLIQMFMPADAFWTLAMAINVYLTFYFKYDAQRLRRMEAPYLICCYGIPFVVALTFIFVSTPAKGRMYGNATLWCWVSSSWDIFRIATFYGPVWIVILITFFIYIRAGREIYKKHKQLKDFTYSHHEPERTPGITDTFSSTKTTEVVVTSEARDKLPYSLPPIGESLRRGPDEESGSRGSDAAAYSVSIQSNRRGTDPYPNALMPIRTNMTMESVPLPPRTANPLKRKAAFEANNATWSYTKCAILFFTAMLVTWIPSSSNRLYSLLHNNQASIALEYMSAFVLPLQGFWNAIIYMVTSWKACKMLFHDSFCCGSSRKKEEITRRTYPMMTGGRGGHKGGDKLYESESMTELAHSRPSTIERYAKSRG